MTVLLSLLALAQASPADLPTCETGPNCLADAQALHDALPVACLDGDAKACEAWSGRLRRVWNASVEWAGEAALDACELDHAEACARAPGPQGSRAPAAPTLVLKVGGEGFVLESFAGGRAPHDTASLPCVDACGGPETYDIAGLQERLLTFRGQASPLLQRCIVVPAPELSMAVVAHTIGAVQSTAEGQLLFPDIVLAGDVQ